MFINFRNGSSPLYQILSLVSLLALAACGGGSEDDNEEPETNFSLSIDVNGSGVITVSNKTNTCDSQCTYSYAENSQVTVIQQAENGFTFVNWTGACSGSDNCNVTMSENLSVGAIFEQNQISTFSLTLEVTGNGTVNSNPDGIVCGNGSTQCNSSFDEGISVSLSQSASSGYIFNGWSGACSGNASCDVEMSQIQTVSANFIEASVEQHTLSVSLIGEGTVTSSPIGIDCGTDCSQIYESGEQVTLTATASTNYTFSEWSGACSGSTSCVVTMSQSQNVTATFDAVASSDATLDITVNGSGSVTSSPAGIDCGNDCSQVFDINQSVQLTAAASTDYSFSEWLGACAGSSAECNLSMTENLQTTAVFKSDNTQIVQQLLTVDVSDHSNTSYGSNGLDSAKIRSGIPFPKGSLSQSDFISVYDGTSQLPTQSKPLSLWDDGSVRWLLFDTEVSLAGNQTKNLTINKINVANDSVNDAIDIQQSTEFFIVSTGELIVEIPRLNGSIIHRAYINNEIVIDEPTNPITDRGAYISMFDSSDSSTINFYSGLLTNISAPKAGGYFKEYEDSVNASSNSDYNHYDPFDLQVIIEEQGDLHSVIKISGAHLNESGDGFSSFIVRLHFYRGENSIKVSHTVVYTGDETQQIEGYGLKLPFASSGATTIIEGQSMSSGTGELIHTEFRNHTLDGTQISGQASGYIGRSKNNVSMGFVLRDMAERFPKALVANETGIEIQLYPSSLTPWDLTRYTPTSSETDASSGLAAEIATREGETNRFANHYFLRGAQGLSTTDDYLIDFSSGAVDSEKLEDLASVIDQGTVMMIAEPAWYSDALVMGVGPFAFDTSLANSEGAYRLDKVLQINRDFMRYNQRVQFDWFGIEDYGDIRGNFSGSAQTNATWSTRGRYGWSGNSGEPSNQLWIQYLRKPSHQTFLDAEALARHSMDQQTVHFATSSAQAGTELDGRNMFSSVGSMHRHGVQSWSGYAGSPDYSHMAGIETYFYLTGDQRAREVIYEQAQFITRDTAGNTSLKNGLDVVDRASAIFFNEPDVLAEFDNKISFFIDYLNSNPDGFDYNAVEAYLIDTDGNGLHDRAEGRKTNRQMFQAGFEYFIRSAPGLLYHHERTADAVAGRLILDAADVLTIGDPNNQVGDGDDWDLGLDGHAGSYFYHMNSIAYAAFIADSLGVSDSNYYALAKLCAEVNTHGGNDNNDTSPISLSTFQGIPDDWTKWNWLWQTDGNFNSNNPGILWLDRTIMYQNDTIQDYHSYRAFVHLASVAAIIKQGDQLELK